MSVPPGKRGLDSSGSSRGLVPAKPWRRRKQGEISREARYTIGSAPAGGPVPKPRLKAYEKRSYNYAASSSRGIVSRISVAKVALRVDLREGDQSAANLRKANLRGANHCRTVCAANLPAASQVGRNTARLRLCGPLRPALQVDLFARRRYHMDRNLRRGVAYALLHAY